MKSWWIYILKCSDGSYYTGRTSNLELRLAQHNNGEGSDWTKSRLPVKLVFSTEVPDEETAYELKNKTKGWSRAKKEALIASDLKLISRLAKKPKFRNTKQN